ncbi:hypothetical protein [Aquimarina aquimarini]|uniref:hypothetical protein n=1 Tax=Aquimarina aquimarini TaxID=1191734 RepID=UPI001F24270D|nr:hypothetical protein [Aquimarina aquimarini]
MVLIKRVIWLIIVLFSVACSKDDTNEGPSQNENEEVEVLEDILDIVSIETIAETPIPKFDSYIVRGDEAFFVKGKDTYVFDFRSATWTFLGTDTDMPDYLDLGQGVSFIRNGKWNLLVDKGLFEFDFNLQDWQVIDLFPQVNGIFSVEGFYIEADNAVYYVDPSNGNEIIYKYDLLTNQTSSYSTRVNDGAYGTISNNAFIVNNSFYYLTLGDWNNMLVSKFNEDFTTLDIINDYETEYFLDSSVAMLLDDNIIFGFGGVPSVDNNETVIYAPSTLKFYYYNITKNTFTEMPTPFYESCYGAMVVSYNNEYYLINGNTITNKKIEARNTIEKIKFDFVKQ